MAKEQLAVAEMIIQMILGKTVTSKTDFHPQKPVFPSELPFEQPFERATPESQGISSALFIDLLQELTRTSEIDMHHFMALRHGKVICECDFAPYPKNMWHVTHSMCKSITAMAIGMLVEEGNLRLDENIYSIFDEKINPFSRLFRPVITVEDLLTMSSGVSFNETGIVSGNDWLGSYLNASVSSGNQEFQYNSMNTYVLSAIVTKRAGESLAEYLRPRLFEPLGITRYFWESDPQGITKGGWGLFLCAEDMAKLGQLYLQKGVWRGQQIVPKQWVEVSTQKHKDTQEGTYGYGYQIWMEERPESFEFNGMLGQNVIIYPDMDMVLVTNAGNKELFQDCVMLNIIRKYFPLTYHPQEQHPENPSALSRLHILCGQLSQGPDFPAPIALGGWKRKSAPRRYPGVSRYERNQPQLCRFFAPTENAWKIRLNGVSYALENQSIGLFAVFIEVFHYNMTDGITEISFSYEQGIFYVSFKESDVFHKLPVGFRRAADGCICLHEEPYLVRTLGEFTTDENHVPVLKLEITYIEECVRRTVHIFFHNEDKIETRWNELPGKNMILAGLNSITDELASRFLYKSILGEETIHLAHQLMEQTIEPVSWGSRIPPQNTEQLSSEPEVLP